MALVNDPKKWAKKIQPQKQQSKAVRAWLEDPRNEHKAKKALAKLVCDGTGKEKKTNKKTANLDSDGGDSSDASCSGKKTKRTASPSSQSESQPKKKQKKACALSSSSDSDAKKKVKKHQLKKKQKKSVVSDSSSGASSSKKKSSKGKKAKEEKKAKKLADSDESNEEHKATKDKKNKKEKKLADSDDSDEEKKAKKMKKDNKEKKLADSDDSDEEKKVKKDAQDKKEAKFTLWSQGDVQQASAAATTMLSDIGSNAGGRFGASELMTLLDNAPQEVLTTLIAKKRREMQSGAFIENTEARKIVNLFLALTAEAEDFYTEQAGGGCGSSAAGVSKEDPKEDADKKDK